MAKFGYRHVLITFYITISFTLVIILFTILNNFLKDDVTQKNHVNTLKKTNTPVMDFPRQWCRIEKWRHDWKGILGECSGDIAWEKRNTTSTDRTSAGKSYIRRWELSPSGHFSRFWIQSVNVKGETKKHGGDAWRVYIRQGPASLAPVVFDHQDGRYEVLFLITEPGVYKAQISLDYTLCDGFRDPPSNWFVIGTVQGKYQKDGVLGYIGDDHILKPLGGRNETTFIINNITSVESQGFFEYCSNYFEGDCTSYKKSIPSCQDEAIPECSLLWNGHGQWIKNRWRPYFAGYYEKKDSYASTSIRKSGTLWLFGDSVNLRFADLVETRPLCTKIFNDCKDSYNWIYQLNVSEGKTHFDGKDFNSSIILNQVRDILNRSDMNHRDSAFVFNMGVHFAMTLNFTTFKALLRDVIQLLFVPDEVSYESGSRETKTEKQHAGSNDPNSNAEAYTREASRKRRFKAYIIWRTTSAMEKEKINKSLGAVNLTFARFATYQRVHLLQIYANSAMCDAGMPILDVYPLTAAYPQGTLDAVHFDTKAFVPVAETLEEFFIAKKNANNVYFDENVR